MRVARVAVLCLVLILGSCGGPAEDRETVRGIVLEVEGDLESVESFLLRTDEGEVLRVVPAPDGDFRFPLPHLHEHRRTSEPLLVKLDRSHDPPRATAIQDADNPAWHGEARTEPVSQATVEPEGPEVAGQEDAAPTSSVTDHGPHPPEDEEAAPPASGADPEAGDEPGAPPATTEATTSTTSEAEAAAGKPVEEADVADGAADSPEPADHGPSGTGDRVDPGPIEDEMEAHEPGGPVIELVIIDGKLEGGARREAVAVGDTVTIRVTGNSDDEVHVHGYDLFVDLVGGAGELTFEASIPGIFEIELEGPHTLLVRLEVS